jgi:pullulanase/glycogen debranching enzyme
MSSVRSLKQKITAGRPWPLGVEKLESEDAFNFALYSLHATAITSHPSIGRATFWREDVTWHGVNGPVDFGADSHCPAYLLHGESVGDGDLYVMINGHWEDHEFTVAEGRSSEWRRVVDTSLPSPQVFSNQERKPNSMTRSTSRCTFSHGIPKGRNRNEPGQTRNG